MSTLVLLLLPTSAPPSSGESGSAGAVEAVGPFGWSFLFHGEGGVDPDPNPDPQADIRVALHSLMSGEAELTDVVGTRIYPAPRPQSAVLPCLTYRLITGNPGHDLRASDGTVRSRFQIEAWSRTTAEAAALSVGLFNALDGFVGTVDGVRITWIAKLDEADLSSLESDGTGDPKRRIVSDYLVQYRVAIPTR
jgi:hypothetical protein